MYFLLVQLATCNLQQYCCSVLQLAQYCLNGQPFLRIAITGTKIEKELSAIISYTNQTQRETGTHGNVTMIFH